MQESVSAIRRHGEEALAALDELPDSQPLEVMKRRLDEAMLALIGMRDEVIAISRVGGVTGDWLPRINSILSTLFGTEFPVGGLSVKRISEGRAALRELLAGKPL